VLGGAAIPVEAAREATDGFSPLKAVLGAISTVYANYEVRLQPHLCSKPFFDEPIRRNPSQSGTRLKISCHGYPRWKHDLQHVLVTWQSRGAGEN